MKLTFRHAPVTGKVLTIIGLLLAMTTSQALADGGSDATASIESFYSKFSGLGIVGLVFLFLQGLAFRSKGKKDYNGGLSALGTLVIILTIGVAAMWGTMGPLPAMFVMGPFVALGALFFLGGMFGDATNEDKAATVGSGFAIALFTGIVWAVFPKPAGPPVIIVGGPPDITFTNWWSGAVQSAPEGYLISDKLIPLRAIARAPDVPLFASGETVYPKEVLRGSDNRALTMKPWHPYYVFQKSKSDLAVLVGESEGARESERCWVRLKDCFCWNTRECVNLEGPQPIYRLLDDAKLGRNPVDPAYAYPYADHFVKFRDKKTISTFDLAALPVLSRDGEFWCFVRPEGSAVGYERCWVRWDGENPGVTCRIRASRSELDGFLEGLRILMTAYEYGPPSEQEEKKVETYRFVVDKIAHNSGGGGGPADRAQTVTRMQGVPKLCGLTQNPIENPLEYNKISAKSTELLKYENDESSWDINDTTYAPAGMIP